MMTLSEVSRGILKSCSVRELEQIMYDIRDDINTRSDQKQVTSMMLTNGLDVTAFCKKKRPS